MMAMAQAGNLRDWHSPEDLQLITELMSDALKYGGGIYQNLMTKFGVFQGDVKNIRFMTQSESLRMGIDLERTGTITNGVEVGKHTDKGINGAKSISAKTLALAYGSISGGHTHSPAQYNGVTRVGSMTPDRQSYHNGGPSTTGGSAVAWVYSDTAVQLTLYASGTFVPNAEAQDAKDFYPFPNSSGVSEYPKFVELPPIPPGGRQQGTLNSRKREFRRQPGTPPRSRH
jgi:hypothetical protein